MSETRPRGGWMSENRPMTPEELKAFLAEPIVARVGTVDADCAPYVTAVWQEWDGEAMWFVPRSRTTFVQHIKHNPKIAVSCAQDTGATARVLMRGKAEIVFGPAKMSGQCLEVAKRMAGRYIGGEEGTDYLLSTDDRPRYLIKLVPETIVSWTGGDWHPRYTAPETE